MTVRTFEIEDLKQTIVKPRAFDALLFGEVVGRDPDLYSFWDSSQRIDPGLNIAQYVNAKVDKLIAEAQASVSPAVRMEKLSAAQDEIRKDYPAVFLYSPQFLYVVPNYLHKKVPLTVLTSSDRFCSVYSWYIETEKIWKIFKKNQ